MKQMIFSAVAALFLLGVNVQAETISFENVQNQILNGLEQHGYLNGLTDSQLKVVEGMVVGAVAEEFGNSDNLTLSEDAQQAFFLETIKKIGNKIKSAIISAADIAKNLAGKASQIISEHGPELMALAQKALPVVAPMAGQLATKLGLPANLITGALAKLSAADQEKAATDEDFAAAAVAKATGN